MAKKGGYQIVVIELLTYSMALELLNVDKPLMVYDGKNKPYFADSIVLNGDDEVVIQKGGQTITIEDDNTITIDGDIAVSGGGGGTQLYKHTFTDITNEKCVIITDNETPIEYDNASMSYHLVGNVLGISIYIDYSGNDGFYWVDGASLATNAGSEGPSSTYTAFGGVIYFKGTTATKLTLSGDLEDVVTPL